MAGAVTGLKGMPQRALEALVNFNCTITPVGPIRPEWLSVREHGIENIQKLVKMRDVKPETKQEL